MSDPERLRLSSDSDLERLLLRSGRTSAPARARQRAILAATAALGAAGLTVGTAAATGLTAKTGSLLSLKWLTVVGLAGLGAITAAAVVNDRRESAGSHRITEARVQLASDRAPVPRSTPVAPSAAASIAPPAAEAPGAPAMAETPIVSPPVVARSEPSSTAEPTSPTTSVHAELATLEQARSALAAGDPAHALSILDSYGATFPRAAMAPEATVLRIEALVRAGDRPAATRVGEAFLASHPQSPYAARVRSLLGIPNP